MLAVNMRAKLQSIIIGIIVLSSPVVVAQPLPPVLSCAEATCEPYDLGPVPFAYSWPDVPTTFRAETVTTMAALQAAVQIDGNAITIPASFGTQSGDLYITANDLDIIMSNSATVNGRVEYGNVNNRASRIRWTGGNVTGGPLILDRAQDIMFNNIHVTSNFMGNWSGGASRIAVINSTIEIFRLPDGRGGGWAIFDTPVGQTDWIVANVNLISDDQNNRFQGITRLIIVDSAFNADGQSIVALLSCLLPTLSPESFLDLCFETINHHSEAYSIV